MNVDESREVMLDSLDRARNMVMAGRAGSMLIVMTYECVSRNQTHVNVSGSIDIAQRGILADTLRKTVENLKSEEEVEVVAINEKLN